MAYHSVVCVKQVPDTKNVTGEAMKADGTVNRAALPAIFNPDDLHALEVALQVRDRFGGTVTAVTMGPPKAADVLRDCLYRGADRAILITDRRAAASDTLATSYILNQAVRRVGKTIGPYDFVFCGRQAIDGDTAQVGPQLAEKLGIPQVTYLQELVDIRDRVARLRRNVGNGWEVVEVRLPVLVTVLDVGEPRPPAARRVMKYKRAVARIELELAAKAALPGASAGELEVEVERRAETLRPRGLLLDQWNLDDIKADLAWCGLAGSPTKVHRVQSIVLTKQGYTEIPPTEEGVRRLIRELVVDHTLG
ncbi:MAG: electron transfer flavoprotein subunit beta/FixA family protein [Planctomycetota bacterium]